MSSLMSRTSPFVRDKATIVSFHVENKKGVNPEILILERGYISAMGATPIESKRRRTHAARGFSRTVEQHHIVGEEKLLQPTAKLLLLPRALLKRYSLN